MSQNKNSLVSIITPVHNSQRYLTETIESVLAQTYPHWEMWIINDASSDASPIIASHYQKADKRIKLINSDIQVGAAKARNLGISAANGRYISFLDADDCWLPSKLEQQITFMHDNGYAFTYTGYESMNSEGETISTKFAPPQINRKLLLTRKHIGCLTVIYDTSYLGKIEMPLIDKRQDLGLWLRLLRATETAHGIKHCLARYRVHSDSMTANKFSAALFTWHLFRKVEGMSLPETIYYFSWYIFSRMLRHTFPNLSTKIGL